MKCPRPCEWGGGDNPPIVPGSAGRGGPGSPHGQSPGGAIGPRRRGKRGLGHGPFEPLSGPRRAAPHGPGSPHGGIQPASRHSALGPPVMFTALSPLSPRPLQLTPRGKGPGELRCPPGSHHVGFGEHLAEFWPSLGGFSTFFFGGGCPRAPLTR